MDEFSDPELEILEAQGLPALPAAALSGFVKRRGVDLWYASFGDGPAVLLLHGGLGNAGNWAYQVPALIDAGYQAVVMDSRAHGRSGWDGTPLSYWQLADDAVAVLDALRVERAAVIGWSDGADTGLVLAIEHPERLSGLVFFACNVDPSGVLPFVMRPIIGRIYARHVADYAVLSPNPDRFGDFEAAVQLMQRGEPNLQAADLGAVRVPVLSLIGEHDEFIAEAHARYIADAIPGARFRLMRGLSHFAPLQRPSQFNDVILAFLAETVAGPRSAQ